MPNKKHKASILVVTMMILGIILTTALSVSIVSIKERKASIGANSSNQAYQAADTGIEKVIDGILANRSGGTLVSDLAASSGLDCLNGVLTKTGTAYEVEVKKDDGLGNPILATCNTKLSEIIAIKSVGTGGNTQRAIEVATAAFGGPGSWNCTIRTNTSAAIALAKCIGNEKVISGGCRVSGTSGDYGLSANFWANGVYENKQQWICGATDVNGYVDNITAVANCCE